MWLDRYVASCRNCADLVAVYESPGGRVALLLRQTPVPLSEERAAWLADTRRAAHAIVEQLRAAGFPGGVLLVQWLPVGEMAEILATWSCRWVGDAARHAQLVAVVERQAADERFLAARGAFRRQHQPPAEEPQPPFATSTDELGSLRRWYDAMGPRWLAIEPALRRALVLRAHRWIADHVLAPAADGRTPSPKDPIGDGSLERALAALIPPDRAADWAPWIRLVAADLELALRRPLREWTTDWVRWLFLIPMAVPVPRPAQARAATGPALDGDRAPRPVDGIATPSSTASRTTPTSCSWIPDARARR
jgi:hypothetical protein